MADVIGLVNIKVLNTFFPKNKALYDLIETNLLLYLPKFNSPCITE